LEVVIMVVCQVEIAAAAEIPFEAVGATEFSITQHLRGPVKLEAAPFANRGVLVESHRFLLFHMPVIRK
jgi:hypothetical protein